MKHLTHLSLFVLGMMIVLTGCDAAKENVEKAKDAGADLAQNAKDLANVDFGDFDMKGLQEKFSGITEGFKNLSGDNVDSLTSKLSGLGDSLEGMGIGDLSGTAKAAVSAAIVKFVDAIKSAMEGVSDESTLSKLKPVVDSLMEKIKAYQ